ncbi:MAG: SDR family oxidoreductase [Deltaproteobacteria bacterium]|nr:SDR family oxidoreductase [Deltaproteobacteria bacterium]MBW2415673.1 SDR family oxidoreductase [Deltaproteobacteria bacterium]
MTEQRLHGKRVLVTQAGDYMGPATIEVFREHGAEVIADESDLTRPGAAQDVVEAAGHIDVLVANLAADARFGISAIDTDDVVWQTAFDVMVHPLHRLCRAVLPQMYERRSGKIVVYGSATGLKATPLLAAYSAARTAQVGYVRSAGVEAASHNVQINLVAQNFVENEAYFPREFQKTPEFEQLMATVPIGRLATAREDALFALFLASGESDFFVGQSIPFSGGWAQ